MSADLERLVRELHDSVCRHNVPSAYSGCHVRRAISRAVAAGRELGRTEGEDFGVANEREVAVAWLRTAQEPRSTPSASAIADMLERGNHRK